MEKTIFKICSRGHKYKNSSSCEFCWPGKLKKGVKKPHIVYHKDGSVWAKGNMINVPIFKLRSNTKKSRIPTPSLETKSKKNVGRKMDGYWEWFRKDGTKMRSGHFKNGKQTGEWITYDKNGKIYKITNIK